MKKLAFFDFDGTITAKDTLLEIIKYQKGTARFYFGFLLNSPFLIGLKLKIISNQNVKERMLTHFFKGMDLSSFQEACDLFAVKVLPSIIRAGAIAEINKLKESGFEVVVVSASVENWIKKWCDDAGIGLIASRLEIVNNRLSGRLAGKNCNGEEKAIRIRSAYNLAHYNDIYAYGDSGGDKQMLALATKAIYKPFRK